MEYLSDLRLYVCIQSFFVITEQVSGIRSLDSFSRKPIAGGPNAFQGYMIAMAVREVVRTNWK